MNIFIEKKGIERYTRDPVPDDKWDSGDTHTSWDIPDKVYIESPTNKKGSYFSERMSVPFDLVSGGTYFLVYAIYSTGSTFGHQSDGCLEYIDLFTTAEKAKMCMEKLSTIPSERKNGNSRTYVMENGQERSFYVPWNGYFESLSDLDIQVVTAI